MAYKDFEDKLDYGQVPLDQDPTMDQTPPPPPPPPSAQAPQPTMMGTPAPDAHQYSDENTEDRSLLIKYLQDRDEARRQAERDQLDQRARRVGDLLTTTAGGILTGSAPKITEVSPMSKLLPESANKMDPLAFARLDLQRQEHQRKTEQGNKGLEYRGQKLEQSDTQFNKRRKDAYDKQFAELGKVAAGFSGGARSAYGRASQVVQRAASLEALAGDPSQYGQLNPAQVSELASGLDTMISNGSPAVERMKQFVPKNMAMTGANILQYFTSNPQAAHQSGFVDYMVNTAKREKAVAMDQMANMLGTLAPGYEHLYNADPRRFDEIMTRGSEIYKGPKQQSFPEGHVPGQPKQQKSNLKVDTNKYKPGTVLKVKGVQYTVQQDGTLE